MTVVADFLPALMITFFSVSCTTAACPDVYKRQRMTRFMARAEQVGIVCSGEDKGSKCTYALLEERVDVYKRQICTDNPTGNACQQTSQ